MSDTIKLPKLTRDLAPEEIRFLRSEDGEDDESAKAAEIEFTLTSDVPLDRWFGTEVLSHAPGAVDLGRARAGAVPLLFNHNWNDPIGMVKDVRIRDGKSYCRAALFKTPRAQEVRQMLEGGLRNVSAGYEPEEVVEDPKQTFTLSRWNLLEASIVTVPADYRVGLGRAQDDEMREVRLVRPVPNQAASAASTKEPTMTTETNAAPTSEPTSTPAVPRQSASALDIERMRRRAIENLSKANNIESTIRDHWIHSGLSVDEVSDDLVRIIEDRSANTKPKTFLDLSPSDQRNFSLFRAVLAAEGRDWSKAGFELECTREIAKRLDKVVDPKTFFVPYDVMQRTVEVPVPYLNRPPMQRDMTVGTAANGGYLVETANMDFIEMLRNRSVAFRMGARRLPGLVGNITIPRQSGAATAGWLANEGATINESQQTLQQVSMSPKTVGAYTEVSRQLMLQSSPAAEGIVTADLAIVTGLAVDTGVLNGSGSNGQPYGILNTNGIGSVTGTSLAFEDILEFQTDVAGANVMPVRGGYATTPAVASLCIQRVKYTNTASPLWEGNIWDGSMQGFPAMSSLQVPTGTMLFGDWSQVIVGEWGVLEVTVNPYANFTGLLIGIRAVVSMDMALRYAGAFSAASSIT